MDVYAEQVVKHHLLATSSHLAYCSMIGHDWLASQIKRWTCFGFNQEVQLVNYLTNSAVESIPLPFSSHLSNGFGLHFPHCSK